MPEFRLNYRVPRDGSGRIVRRVPDLNTFNVEMVDVTWTHEDGFRPDTLTEPVSFDYASKVITYAVRELPPRIQLEDQVTVPYGTSDTAIIMILESKRHELAKALGVPL